MPTDPMETPRVIEVVPGVFVRSAVDNMAWIDLGGQALVVDALEQPELADEVLADIARTLPDIPVRTVLNTHTHHDHVALNRAFEQRCGAEIVNQDVAPLPSDGRVFEGTRTRLVMLPMGGTHTEGDAVVWLERDRVLLVGDIFGYGLIPLIRPLDDASAQLVRQVYRRLIAFDAAVVVPGHGPVCTAGELVRWLTYFDWLIDQARVMVRKGSGDDQIIQQLAPPRDMRSWWRFVQWKHEDSVRRVIQALRRGNLR